MFFHYLCTQIHGQKLRNPMRLNMSVTQRKPALCQHWIVTDGAKLSMNGFYFLIKTRVLYYEHYGFTVSDIGSFRLLVWTQ